MSLEVVDQNISLNKTSILPILLPIFTNNVKAYNIPLVWLCIQCESKMKKQDLQPVKVNHRIPVLQLARSKSNKQKETEV